MIPEGMASSGKDIREAREAKGLSQQQVADAVGISQPTVQKIEDGRTVRSRYLPEIEKFLGMHEKLSFDVVPLPGALSAGASLFGPRDLKLFAAAECGPGEMVVDSEPIDRLHRPAYLGDVTDGYAVLVVGESMIPAFRPGQIVVINPRLPPLRDKDMLFFQHDEPEGSFRASIKHLVRWTTAHWYVEQHNPPEDGMRFFTLDRERWGAHRIIGRIEG